MGNSRGAPCLPVGTNIFKLNADSVRVLCDLYSCCYVMLSFHFLFKVKGMVNAREFHYFFLIRSFFFWHNSPKIMFVQNQLKKTPFLSSLCFPSTHQKNSFSWFPQTMSCLPCFEPNWEMLLSICYTESASNFYFVSSCSGLAIWSVAFPVLGYLYIKGT